MTPNERSGPAPQAHPERPAGSGASTEVLARNAHHLIRRVQHAVHGEVIVKHICADVDSPTLRARLENEFMLAAALGSDTPRPAIALETIDGAPALLFGAGDAEPLRTRARSMPLEARLELAVEAADALTRLHRLGITHNDVSLDNMLVAGDGQVLLIDLELATLAARETCEALHPLDLPGTLSTQAPSARAGRVDNRIDELICTPSGHACTNSSQSAHRSTTRSR